MKPNRPPLYPFTISTIYIILGSCVGRKRAKNGLGIPRMQEAMREANLPEPEFHTEGIFTAVFKRKITNSANYDTVNGRVNDIVNDTINENEQAILNLLATTPGLNASEISKHINKSLRTTMRYIKVLQDKTLIEFRGAPKTGGYFLKNETYEI